MFSKILCLVATVCFLPNNLHGEFQSDQKGLKKRGDYSCNYVYMFTQICTDGTQDYPPRLNAVEKPNQPLEYETFGAVKNNGSLSEYDYLVSPNGDAYFFVDHAGDLFVFNKVTRIAYFTFSVVRRQNFGVHKGPYRVQYVDGQLKLFDPSGLLETLNLHAFNSQTSAIGSQLVVDDDNILKIKVGDEVVWSSNAVRVNQVLKQGQSIFSENGKFECSLDEHCQFVVYDRQTYEQMNAYGTKNAKQKCILRITDTPSVQISNIDWDPLGFVENFRSLTTPGDRKMLECPDNGEVDMPK